MRSQVVIPGKLQSQMLRELHSSHPGIVRMKGLARTHIWWPGVSTDIEKTVKGVHSLSKHLEPPTTIGVLRRFLVGYSQ